ncbi:hypothetical protein GCM10018966_102140 [Streptomyces yanii]
MAGEGLGRLLFVGCLDRLVDELHAACAADPVVEPDHQQLGQEHTLGHLVAGSAVGQVWELLPDGEQSQQAANLADRDDGGLFGQLALAVARTKPRTEAANSSGSSTCPM